MPATRIGDEAWRDQGAMSGAVRRRGILAAAVAAVVAVAARQAETVQAATSSLQYPSSGTTAATNTATAKTVLQGTFDDTTFKVENDNTTARSVAIEALSAGGQAISAQVLATSILNSTVAVGAANLADKNFNIALDAFIGSLSATATNTSAVRAVNQGTGGGRMGVAGQIDGSGTNNVAVRGLNQATGTGAIGVLGVCTVAAGGIGVKGDSVSGTGVLGTISAGSTNNTVAVSGTNISGGSGGIGVLGTIGTGTTNSTNTIAVSGTNLSGATGGIGVNGQCDAATGIGVKGASLAGIGVLGAIPSGSTPNTVAVKATNVSSGNGGIGMFAVAGGNGGNNTIAVRGLTGSVGTGGVGVRGECDAATGVGVLGMSSVGTGVRGESNIASASDGNGVFGFVHHVGSSQVTAGVFGDSDASYGVIGRTSAASYSGCTGIANTPNTAAFAGAGTGGAICAFFTGATIVQGDFTVVGGAKNAAVKHTDGSYRLLHCVEAPEAWFEDFGKNKLIGGRADVRLDADFAAVVDASDYHIFLTPYGNTNGLHVVNQTPGGFVVEEHNGGKGNLTFSWRVVARRKDITAGRLAKFELPKIKLPKPEELPKHA